MRRTVEACFYLPDIGCVPEMPGAEVMSCGEVILHTQRSWSHVHDPVKDRWKVTVHARCARHRLRNRTLGDYRWVVDSVHMEPI